MGEITVTRSIITSYDVNDIVIYRETDSALRATIGIGKVKYYSYNQGRDVIEYHIVGNLVKDLARTNNTLHTNIIDEENILGKVNFDSYKALMDYNPDDKNSNTVVSSKYEIGDTVSYFTNPSHKLIPDEPIDAHSSFGEIVNKYSNEDGTFYYDIKDKKKDYTATVLEEDIIGTVVAF